MAGRVLLVDDEAGVIKAISRLLADEPYDIVTAKSGREALGLMATTAIDVIISDERMPGMSGVELLEAVSRIHPQTIRIILTGHADTGLVFQAINDGKIYRFLSKPWDDRELLAIVRQAMATKEVADGDRGKRQGDRGGQGEKG